MDILNDFEDIGIEVETKFLEKDNFSVLNTLVENPILLALQEFNGTGLIKDKWFEKTLGYLLFAVYVSKRCMGGRVEIVLEQSEMV